MALTKKQEEIDKMKWAKSEEQGADACGTFDFCEKCDKTVENPCDKAYTSFNNAKKGTAKKAPKEKAEVKATKPKAKSKTTTK